MQSTEILSDQTNLHIYDNIMILYLRYAGALQVTCECLHNTTITCDNFWPFTVCSVQIRPTRYPYF